MIPNLYPYPLYYTRILYCMSIYFGHIWFIILRYPKILRIFGNTFLRFLQKFGVLYGSIRMLPGIREVVIMKAKTPNTSLKAPLGNPKQRGKAPTVSVSALFVPVFGFRRESLRF